MTALALPLPGRETTPRLDRRCGSATTWDQRGALVDGPVVDLARLFLAVVIRIDDRTGNAAENAASPLNVEGCVCRHSSLQVCDSSTLTPVVRPFETRPKSRAARLEELRTILAEALQHLYVAGTIFLRNPRVEERDTNAGLVGKVDVPACRGRPPRRSVDKEAGRPCGTSQETRRPSRRGQGEQGRPTH